MQDSGPNNPIDYRALLKEELARRCRHNPRYSLRSFAKDLTISPSRLSSVLNGRFGLSGGAALLMAKKLRMNEQESQNFLYLVESKHARGKAKREIALEKLKLQSKPLSEITLDHFRVISDWYHFAIMELTKVKGFNEDSLWISKRLQISVYEAKLAIDRLVRLKFLIRSKKGLRAAESYFVNTAELPGEAIRKFHYQILEKAQSALTFQPVKDRDYRSFTVAIDPAEIPIAKKMIRSFAADFNNKISRSPEKTEVYNLSIQFFSVERSPTHEGNKYENKN